MEKELRAYLEHIVNENKDTNLDKILMVIRDMQDTGLHIDYGISGGVDDKLIYLKVGDEVIYDRHAEKVSKKEERPVTDEIRRILTRMILRYYDEECDKIYEFLEILEKEGYEITYAYSGADESLTYLEIGDEVIFDLYGSVTFDKDTASLMKSLLDEANGDVNKISQILEELKDYGYNVSYSVVYGRKAPVATLLINGKEMMTI